MEIPEKESFFDENSNEHGPSKLLNFIINPYSNLLNEFSHFSEDRLCEGVLNKKAQDSERLRKKFFVLYRDRLEVFDNQLAIVLDYYIMLKGVRVVFYGHFDHKEEMKYSIILQKNGINYMIFPSSKIEFKGWRENLKKCCILQNFGKFYSNLNVVGEGSFAQVMMASRNADKKLLAVKTFNKEKLWLSSKLNRTRISLMNEINILRIANHPNIIKLHEVYEGENHIYLVMDFLKGGELHHRLTKNGAFNEHEAYLIFSQLVNAVKRVHQMGVIHRDIKAENVIFKSKSTLDVVLADFGLAEFTNKEENLNRRCGTPGYIAPEVILKEIYSPKADVFSLGILLFIMLTGTSPFYSVSVDEVLYLNVCCEISFDFNIFGVELSTYGSRKYIYLVMNLLHCMLEKENEDRYSLEMVLNHPWVCSETAPQELLVNSESSETDIENHSLTKMIEKLNQSSYFCKFIGSNTETIANLTSMKMTFGFNQFEQEKKNYHKSIVFDNDQINEIIKKKMPNANLY